MSRSIKKGPFCDEHLMKKVDALNAANKKHIRRIQRQRACSRICNGRHGRT